jgi:hypothetical protein
MLDAQTARIDYSKKAAAPNTCLQGTLAIRVLRAGLAKSTRDQHFQRHRFKKGK